MDQGLTHIDHDGNAAMVDVSGKPKTLRRAIFTASVVLNEQTMSLLLDKALPKGDVLTTAKIAGIQAAKKTWELIPMCHPLALTYLDVRFDIDVSCHTVHIQAEARTTAGTGVEMEALVAVQCAAMTLYDMCKAVQRDILITDCRLLFKSGGRSGTYEYTG